MDVNKSFYSPFNNFQFHENEIEKHENMTRAKRKHILEMFDSLSEFIETTDAVADVLTKQVQNDDMAKLKNDIRAIADRFAEISIEVNSLWA